MSDLESRTRYEPAEVEPRIAKKWLDSGLFHPRAEGVARDNYSIAIPPPNVTGVLHMGHAFQDSIMDTLIRHHRMLGQRTKWILGTDHAGIATQTQVERALEQEGTSREELGRDQFVQRVWEWRAEHGGTIIEQLKRLGASADYAEERFTLDELYAQAVLKVFVSLYEKGYIYRDRYMVNWDAGTGSAISDLEVETREVTDTLYYIDYPLASGSGAITVATVRPETMLADTAIAVHPDDERYRRLIGEKAVLPLVGRKLRIIADEYVRPEFGTGALKITPAHDPNDFEIGRRHGLAQPSVIGEDGRITAEAPERFAGLTDPRGAGGGRLRAQGAGADRADRVLRSRRAVLPALGRAHRAADLAAVVHAHGRACGAGDRGRHQRADPLSPREPQAGVSGLDGEHPALVHLTPAVVGAPAAGVVPGRRRPSSAPRPRGARAGSAIRTCSTPGSRVRCGRS